MGFAVEPYAPPVEVRVLGPLEVIDDDGCAVELRGAKLNAFVAVLALRVGEVVSAGRIIEDLWGDQEIRDPLNALQVVVSKVRRALGALFALFRSGPDRRR